MHFDCACVHHYLCIPWAPEGNVETFQVHRCYFLPVFVFPSLNFFFLLTVSSSLFLYSPCPAFLILFFFALSFLEPSFLIPLLRIFNPIAESVFACALFLSSIEAREFFFFGGTVAAEMWRRANTTTRNTTFGRNFHNFQRLLK